MTVTPDDESHVDDAADLLRLRERLTRRFGVLPVAFSSDGFDVEFSVPLELGLEVGGFGVVEHNGEALLIQIRRVTLVTREGPLLQLAQEQADLDDEIGLVSVRPLMRSVAGSARILGRLAKGSFVPVDRVAAFAERIVRPATGPEVAAAMEQLDAGQATITLGTLHQAPGVPARIRSKGLSRHTFMCGQSGSGKTYTTGVIFEHVLADTTLPIVVLDPNSDHVHLGRLLDDDDRSPDAARYRRTAGSVRVARARGAGGDFTLCADFSDLDLDSQALLLRLRPIEDLDEFHALRRITATLTAPYSAGDVARAATADASTQRLALRVENLGIADWGLWRRDGEESIRSQILRHERCVVIDTGSLAEPDERTAVALNLLAARWALRSERQPVLIVIDEAHNVLPASTDDPLLRAATDLGVLIAGEGRKYGLHLFVATQRPGKVHPNVVSQCDNLVLMRMNGSADVAELEALFSHVPAPLLRTSLSFGLGQAVLAGPIAPTPLLARIGRRLTPEGGGDVPTTWAAPPPT